MSSQSLSAEALRMNEPVAQMLKLIAEQPNLYRDGMSANVENGRLDMTHARSVVIYGIGGSGIVGRIVSELCRDMRKPLIAVNSARLPSWLEKEDALIVVSYSGNTLEAIVAARRAVELGVPTAIVTSGGVLEKDARSSSLPLAKVASGLQPRMAVPSMVGAAIKLLSDAGLPAQSNTLSKAVERLAELTAELAPEVGVEENQAKSLAIHVNEGLPHVFASQHLATPAYRFKTQLNENAKQPCIYHEIPESMHNELEALPFRVDDRYVLLRSSGETEDIRAQLDFVKDNFPDRAKEARIGNGWIEEVLAFITLVDYVSVYLAALKGVDPIPVNAIKRLREVLEKKAWGKV